MQYSKLNLLEHPERSISQLVPGDAHWTAICYARFASTSSLHSSIVVFSFGVPFPVQQKCKYKYI